MNNIETMTPNLQIGLEKATSHTEMLRIMDSTQIREKAEAIDAAYKKKQAQVDTMKLALATLENPNTANQTALSQLSPENKAIYDKLINVPEEQKSAKILELKTIIAKLTETLKKSDQISEKAEKAVEKAQESWYNKVWSSVKKFGGGIVETIKKIPQKVKEFVSSTTGKKILKYTAITVGVLAIGALALWIIGAPMDSSTGKLFEEGRKKFTELLNKLGLDWIFPSGIEDTI